jgi:chromosome segregation ATPase
MDKPTIQAAVWHAADQLFSAGIRPTVANIREITKRGSAGTINQALKEWWRDLSCRVNAQERRPDVPEPVAEAMCQLWATSLDRAEHALQTYREDAEQQVKHAKAQYALADLSRAQTEERCRALEEEAAALHLSNAELQRNLAAESALRKELDSRAKSIREEAGKAVAEMNASLLRMEKQCELEKEHYQTLERSLTAQAADSRRMRLQAEKRLAETQACAAATEKALRAEVLEYKERCARQSERSALLDERIGMLEFELNQAKDKMHALLSENTMLGSLTAGALVPARIAARMKTYRVKKRRF